MTNVYYYVDDGNVVHWVIYDPDSEDDGTREILEEAEGYGWQVQTFIEGIDNGTLSSLGDFLFREFHDDDGDLKDYLLDRFDRNIGAFAYFLVRNHTRDDIRDLRDRLTKALRN